MDEFITYSLKIFYHFFFAVSSYYCVKLNHSNDFKFLQYNFKDKENRIGIIAIVYICILQVIYSMICGPNGKYIGDRRVYALHFDLMDNDASTVGLGILCDLLWNFTRDADYLFICVAVIYSIMTCVTYNVFKNANPTMMLITGLSLFYTYGCFQLKQALASVFVAFALALYVNQKVLLSIIVSVIAITFHETALFGLIIIMLFIFAGDEKKYYFISIMILFFTIFVLEYITPVLIYAFKDLFPVLDDRVLHYFNDDGSLILENNYLTAIKGLPFYFISIYGLRKRKYLCNKIVNYDKFLFLSIIVSYSFIASTYMYWLWRIGELFYLPVFYYWSLIEKNNCVNSRYYVYILFIIFTLYQLIITYYYYGGII